MFEVFVKDLINGTRIEEMSTERYIEIIKAWSDGEDIVVDGRMIKNKFIESVYARSR